MKSVLDIHWKDWCWSWSSNTLVTWCEVLTHWKRPGCWEKIEGRRRGDDRGWNGWMASSTWWTWVCTVSGSWWWTRKPGVLQPTGLQRVRHDSVAELNWTATTTLNLLAFLEKNFHKKSLVQQRFYTIQIHTIKIYSWTIQTDLIIFFYKAAIGLIHDLISIDCKIRI